MPIDIDVTVFDGDSTWVWEQSFVAMPSIGHEMCVDLEYDDGKIRHCIIKFMDVTWFTDDDDTTIPSKPVIYAEIIDEA